MLHNESLKANLPKGRDSTLRVLASSATPSATPRRTLRPPGYPTDPLTRGGVHALTTSLASELTADNVRVNAVAPSVVGTPILGDADVDAFGALALLYSIGESQEITEAVTHIATAGFTTGVIMPVDGGHVHARA